MKKSKSILKKVVMISLMLVGNQVLADSVQFQNVRVGGIGCPSEKTQIAYAPDNSTATLIFQDFQSHVPVVSNGPKQQPYISQLPCNVFVEVKLPVGQKLDSLEVKYDMRGNAMLDQGVQGYFKSYLMSSSGLGVERLRGRVPELVQEKNWINYSVEQIEDFTVVATKKISFGSQCRTQIGQDRVYIQLQHHILTKIMKGYENSGAQGTIMMDTSDISGGLKLIAQTSSCNGGGSSTPVRNCRIVRVGGRAQEICQ